MLAAGDRSGPDRRGWPAGLDLRALSANSHFFDGTRDVPVVVSASADFRIDSGAKLGYAAFDISALIAKALAARRATSPIPIVTAIIGNPVSAGLVAVTPAGLDEDGRVGADGWLPDHVRLGGLEAYLGEGVVEEVVAAAAPAPTRPERKRLMSLPLVARLVLAMTLLPNASYVEAMAQLVGVLPRLVWLRD